jgi:hypothetical protein
MNPNTPARSNVQGKQQTLAFGKGFNIARVNQVSVDATTDGADIAISTFYINLVLQLYYLILELHIRSFMLDISIQMSYHFKLCKNP